MPPCLALLTESNQCLLLYSSGVSVHERVQDKGAHPSLVDHSCAGMRQETCTSTAVCSHGLSTIAAQLLLLGRGAWICAQGYGCAWESVLIRVCTYMQSADTRSARPSLVDLLL